MRPLRPAGGQRRLAVGAALVLVAAAALAGCGGSSFLHPILRVKGVVPTDGPSAGGDSILVAGSGFVENVTQVFFGEAQVDPGDVEFLSAVRLRIALPAADGLGFVDVRVVNPGSDPGGDVQDVLPAAFLYFASALDFDTYRNVRIDADPVAATVADINGDSRPDLLVSHRGDTNGVSTVVNFGAADLRQTSFLALPGDAEPDSTVLPLLKPNLIASDRLDSDVFTDFAVTVIADRSGPEFLTFTGLGDGSFERGPSFRAEDLRNTDGPRSGHASTDGPTGIMQGDFNEDGNTDLVVSFSSSRNVGVFFGDGGGDFTGVAILESGNRPLGLTVSDLNGDQHSDVIVTNTFDGTVSVFYGLGIGRFREADESPFSTGLTGANPLAVAAGHFDGDAIRDLLVLNSGEDTLAILHGDGFGGFLDPVGFRTGRAPTSLVTADLDGDGRTDAAVANSKSDSMTVFLQRDKGEFVQESYCTGAIPQTVLAANFDGDADGRPDLLVVDTGGGTISIHRNLGDGFFEQPDLLGTGDLSSIQLDQGITFESPEFVRTGDYDGDGIDDALVLDTSRADLTFLRGLDAGDLDESNAIVTPISRPPSALDQADLDGDGAQDLALVDESGVLLLFGSGTGAFVERDLGTPGLHPIRGDSVSVGDVDGDGALDLVLAETGEAQVAVLLGDGAGGFPESRITPLPHTSASPLSGDWNVDGRLDLAIPADDGEGAVMVLLGTSAGTFATAQEIPLATPASGGAAADFNDDGLLDLALILPERSAVLLLAGTGEGSFVEDREIEVGIVLERIVPAELNGDRHVDLVGLDTDGNEILVFRNRGASAGFDAPLLLGTADEPVDLAPYRPGSRSFRLPDLLVAHRTGASVAQIRNRSR